MFFLSISSWHQQLMCEVAVNPTSSHIVKFAIQYV